MHIIFSKNKINPSLTLEERKEYKTTNNIQFI